FPGQEPRVHRLAQIWSGRYQFPISRLPEDHGSGREDPGSGIAARRVAGKGGRMSTGQQLALAPRRRRVGQDVSAYMTLETVTEPRTLSADQAALTASRVV